MPTPPPKLVRVKTPCWTCGYELCHLPVDHHCPECGTAIAWTIGGYQLVLADRAWLTRIWRGCTIYFWCLSSLAVSTFFVVMAMFKGIPALRAAAGLIVLALLVGVQAGVWLLTAPEPAGVLDGDRRLRRWTRGLAAVGTLAAQAFVALWLTGQPAGESWVWLTAAWLPGAAGFVMLVHVLATLASRLPDAALHRDLSRFGFVMAIYGAAVPAAWLMPAVIKSTLPSTVIYGAAVVLAFLLLAWFHLMLLELMRSIAADLRQGRSAAAPQRTAQFHLHREPS